MTKASHSPGTSREIPLAIRMASYLGIAHAAIAVVALALVVLGLIVWWTMFSGRKGGELKAPPPDKNTEPPTH